MPVYTICPTCNAGYDLADTLRGKRVICQNCKDAFLVQETVRAPVGTAIPLAPEPANPLLPASGPSAGGPKPPPLLFGQPGYDVNPPGQPAANPDEIPVATVATDPYIPVAQPAPDPRWERLPRRRTRRRPESSGLSTGAIVALVVGPLVLLLAVGLLLWWVLSRPSRSEAWVDDNPPRFQNNPAPRPGFVPVIIPGPRVNNPAPPRFNPPVRINPPVRFNPPPRIRFR